jgi:hypothetical protein
MAGGPTDIDEALFDSAPTEPIAALRWELPPALGVVQPVAPQPAASPAPAVSPRARARARRVSLSPLGLYLVLSIQAVLSLRLIWSNSAFLDEATYLFVGHVELAHLLTGSPVPAYPTYLSGAPVIYPPVAAIAADIGGLAGARILSLGFMLGATALLWDTTSRLAGRRAAFFAAASFAALGPTQYLGAFATYDAMALFLLTVAAWCVVAAHDRSDSTWMLLAGALVLAFANATKYATGIFDPVVIALAGLSISSGRGVKPALGRAGFVAVSAVGLLGLLLGIGGPLYVTGVLATTLARASGLSSPVTVLTDSARWIGPDLLLAAAGVVLVAWTRRSRVEQAIVALLAVAGLLVPLNQARIDTTTSLSKQVDFGAWFAAIAAGYALAWLSGMVGRTAWQAVPTSLAVATVAGLAIIGRAQAADFFQVWPDSTAVVADLATLTRAHPGNYLAEDFDVPAYYLEDSIPWQRWFNTWYFAYTVPGPNHMITGPPAYRAAIEDHYFSLIILDFGDTASMDKRITQYIRDSGDYHVIGEAPYWDKFGSGQFTIWAYQPPRLPQGAHRGRNP